MWDGQRTPCKACFVYMAPDGILRVRLYFLPSLLSCMEFFCVDRSLIDGEPEVIHVNEVVREYWVRWHSEIIDWWPTMQHVRQFTRQGRKIYAALCEMCTWRRLEGHVPMMERLNAGQEDGMVVNPPIRVNAEVVHPDSGTVAHRVKEGTSLRAGASTVEYMEISSDAEEPPVPFPVQSRADTN